MTLRYYLVFKKNSQINSIFSNNEWKADANENLDVLFLKRSILVSNIVMIYRKAIVKTMLIKKKKRLNVQISESVLLAGNYLWFSREAPGSSPAVLYPCMAQGAHKILWSTAPRPSSSLTDGQLQRIQQRTPRPSGMAEPQKRKRQGP